MAINEGIVRYREVVRQREPTLAAGTIDDLNTTQ
jgi:hypothetical protein